MSRAARAVIRQNLLIALGAVALLIPATLFGWAGLGLAVLIHEGSTIVVVFNALRLLTHRGPPKAGTIAGAVEGSVPTSQRCAASRADLNIGKLSVIENLESPGGVVQKKGQLKLGTDSTYRRGKWGSRSLAISRTTSRMQNIEEYLTTFVANFSPQTARGYKPQSVGSSVMQNVLAAGFGGPIFPVNPNATEVHGLPAYSDVASLPIVPDVAVIATPPDIVPSIVAELGSRGTLAD